MKWSGGLYGGARGRAWEARFKVERAHAGLGEWVVEARWAHPFWWQYLVFIVHLREGEGLPAAKKHRSDVTHEFHVYALDPDLVVEPRQVMAPGNHQRLTPANMAYQFAAPSDAAAVRRVLNFVEAIADGTLNPDTDARRDWNNLMADSYGLVRNAMTGV